jgi:outer membrane protein assembly factor BamE
MKSFISKFAAPFVLPIALLAGCGSTVPVLPGLTPYKMDVQQGNVVTQDMVSKLKTGMTRQQVRFVMGTPPIVDAFRTDRWDYVYRYQKRGVVSEQRRITLLFDGDLLKRIEGDVVPAGTAAEPTQGKPPDSGAAPAKSDGNKKE